MQDNAFPFGHKGLNTLSSETFRTLQMFNPHILTYNVNVQMKLLNPVLKKLHVESLAVSEWYFSNQHNL